MRMMTADIMELVQSRKRMNEVIFYLERRQNLEFILKAASIIFSLRGIFLNAGVSVTPA